MHSNQPAFRLFLFALGLALLAASCSSAYYGVMEKFGHAKREILVDRVEEGRNAQQDAKKEFQSALDAFKSVTGFSGGDLEALYTRLNGNYQDCSESVDTVKERIESIETVAGDMFSEWKQEIGEIHSPDLRAKSESMRKDTQRQYGELIAAMKRAESKMDPVLVDFKDRVLFLKHNLNANAIASLKGDLGAIEGNVGALIKDMEASIAEADRFISSMAQS